jgi:KUP system potassium uptake protein
VVLEAINPLNGIGLLVRAPGAALAILGGVFLCATGGEALYADMGHFGRPPIRLAWYAVALPALLLSYAGQTGAMIDGIPKGANPFFVIAPHWSVIPLVVLAALATIIASQAIITGAFSMTRQAMQLGWLPGVEIRQTSDKVYGQIYVPAVNGLMAVGTILITLIFQSSDRLAGAYGTAVSTTMVLTTFLLIRAMTRTWRWSLLIVVPVGGLFLAVDFSFFVANLAKIVDGGWIPLSLGGAIYAIMVTWRTGVQSLRARLAALTETVPRFLAELADDKITRVPGAAVFLTRPTDRVPSMMLQTARQMGSLHAVVIALHLKFEEEPRVADDQRWSVEAVADKFWRVTLCYGFIEAPNLVQALREAPGLPKDLDWDRAVFFTTREVVSPKAKHGLDRLRIKIFAFFFKNAARVTDRFNLPPDRTIEVAHLVQI